MYMYSSSHSKYCILNVIKAPEINDRTVTTLTSIQHHSKFSSREKRNRIVSTNTKAKIQNRLFILLFMISINCNLSLPQLQQTFQQFQIMAADRPMYMTTVLYNNWLYHLKCNSQLAF